MKKVDVLVIGAGPAGYVCAIRAAQLGMTTACVDAWVGRDGKPALGGTCLNVGCIPSKAWLESSERYHELLHKVSAHGIKVKEVTLDVPAMAARKDKIVTTLTKGIEGLFKKNKVQWIPGVASFTSANTVEVKPSVGNGDPETVEAEHIIIATGSVPRNIAVRSSDSNFCKDAPLPILSNEPFASSVAATSFAARPMAMAAASVARLVVETTRTRSVSSARMFAT